MRVEMNEPVPRCDGMGSISNRSGARCGARMAASIRCVKSAAQFQIRVGTFEGLENSVLPTHRTSSSPR